jgi:ubiquinone/menaquinone biosynthesis C-methylase UbiE
VSAEGYDPALFEAIAAAEPRSFWFRSRNRLVERVLRRWFPAAESLLEVGCGNGFVLAGLREAFPAMRLVGAELYDEGLAVARRRLGDRVELVQADARELPWADEFDVVAALDVLEHVEEDDLVLERMARAARRGGGIVLLVPQHPRLWSDADVVAHHRRRYTRPALTRLVRDAGLDVVFAESWVSTLLPAALLSRAARRTYDPVAELVPPDPLNALFERLLDAEAALVARGVSLPAGTSLLVVARKP